MGIYLLSPDANLVPCGCEGRPNPCDTCSTGDMGGFECRSRGGNAFMCGRQGFVETNPYQFYASSTVAGHVAWCVHAGDGIFCGPGSNAESRFKSVYHGTVTTTCTTTDGNYLQDSTSEILPCCSPCSYSPSGPTTTTVATLPPAGAFFADVTVTETKQTWSYDNHCVVCDGYCSFDGEVTQELSGPDSDSAAIARLLAASQWSEWGGGITSCTAAHQSRTDALFAYAEAEWRVNRRGLIASTNYRVTMPIYRQLYNAGPATLYQTVIFTATSDGSGTVLTDGHTVPNTEGFKTYADFDKATFEQI